MYNTELSGEDTRVPKLAISLILLLIVSVIALVILIGSQRPDSSTRAASFEYAIATEQVVSGEDIIIGVDYATLYVPSGAVTVAGTITIFSRESDLFPLSGEPGWSRPMAVNIEYRNEQGALYPFVSFAKPAQICFQVTRQRWNDYLSRSDEFQVQYYDERQEPPRWVSLPFSANSDHSQLCGQTDHLSLFALAIKMDAVIPVTGLTPTPTPNPSSGQFNSSPNDSSNNKPGDVYEP